MNYYFKKRIYVDQTDSNLVLEESNEISFRYNQVHLRNDFSLLFQMRQLTCFVLYDFRKKGSIKGGQGVDFRVNQNIFCSIK